MSFLDVLEPVFRLLPEVKGPVSPPSLSAKLKWTAGILVLFFVMGSVSLIGVDISHSAGGQLQALQYILASNIGTLLSAGIGPIVLASIILQLLVGGKIIEMDLSDPKQKAKFSSLQKLLAIILCFFEAIAYVLGGLLAPLPGMAVWVVLQVAIGSIILLFLDEVVSKYGIGSGIGLFIAAGVSAQILWRIFNPFDSLQQLNLGNASGLIYLFFNNLSTGFVGAFVSYLLPIIMTFIVFFIVVFAEGIHVNIPITMGRAGIGGRFPVKLLYVSNVPVILAVAFFANIQILALVMAKIPVIGWLMQGLSNILTVQNGLLQIILLQGNLLGALPQLGQALAYLAVFIVTCVVFGKLWVELAGQGSEAIAGQLNRSGMFIPGFRRDPRVVQQVLDRYIPTITILGSAFVGLLAGFADLTDAIGTGTGILLTVGIVYRLYEELAKEQLLETNPLLKRVFG
jgi:preprotein translocase subunit SecY